MVGRNRSDRAKVLGARGLERDSQFFARRNIVPLADEIAVSIENKNCQIVRRGIDIQLVHDRAIEIRDCV